MKIRKILAVLLVLALTMGIVAVTVACNDDEDETPITSDYNFNYEGIAQPAGINDYELKIEWIDAEGKETTFKNQKPVVILFAGVTENTRKESYTLPEDVYTRDLLASSIKDTMDRNTSSYWIKAGYNVGVFHYESFADDTQENVSKKIYSKAFNTYKTLANQVGTANFNLTEAFVSTWKKVVDVANLNGNNIDMFEVRFVGNSVGANLALSASDYLYEMYLAGKIAGNAVPNRVSIINPYFSNVGDATIVDYRNEKTIGSALSYNNEIIEKLAKKGMIFDMYENDEDFYDSYGDRYTGVAVSESEGQTVVNFTEIGDSGLYLNIKKYVAYVNFTETFSQDFPESYKRYDRAVLDWYLYSMGGSDSTSVSVRDDGYRAHLDYYSHSSVSYTSLKYAVTAWTPTVYLRAVRGVEYRMVTVSGSNIKSYYMSNFQAETNQKSNMNILSDFFLCGYVYTAMDGTDFVNLRYDARLSGVKVNLSVAPTDPDNSNALDSTKLKEYSVYTEEDGFYRFNMPENTYGYKVDITVVTPSKDYSYRTNSAASGTWQNVTTNSIISSGNIATMSGTSENNFYLIIRNCGLNKA